MFNTSLFVGVHVSGLWLRVGFSASNFGIGCGVTAHVVHTGVLQVPSCFWNQQSCSLLSVHCLAELLFWWLMMNSAPTSSMSVKEHFCGCSLWAEGGTSTACSCNSGTQCSDSWRHWQLCTGPVLKFTWDNVTCVHKPFAAVVQCNMTSHCAVLRQQKACEHMGHCHTWTSAPVQYKLAHFNMQRASHSVRCQVQQHLWPLIAQLLSTQSLSFCGNFSLAVTDCICQTSHREMRWSPGGILCVLQWRLKTCQNPDWCTHQHKCVSCQCSIVQIKLRHSFHVKQQRVTNDKQLKLFWCCCFENEHGMISFCWSSQCFQWDIC